MLSGAADCEGAQLTDEGGWATAFSLSTAGMDRDAGRDRPAALTQCRKSSPRPQLRPVRGADHLLIRNPLDVCLARSDGVRSPAPVSL